MARLTISQARQRLESLPLWTLAGKEIRRTFEFPGFAGAMRFVNRVARAAEASDHHPDIDIRWNRVTLALTTHSEGGLTPKDFALARRCGALFRAGRR